MKIITYYVFEYESKLKWVITLSPKSKALKSLIGRMSTSLVSNLIVTRPFLSPDWKNMLNSVNVENAWVEKSYTHVTRVFNFESGLIWWISNDIIIVCLEVNRFIVVTADVIEPAYTWTTFVDKLLSSTWRKKSKEFELRISDIIIDLEAFRIFGEPWTRCFLNPPILFGRVLGWVDTSGTLLFHITVDFDGVLGTTTIWIDVISTLILWVRNQIGSKMKSLTILIIWMAQP